MSLRTEYKNTDDLPVDIEQPQEAIRLESVSVCYTVPRERIGTFKEYLIRRIQRQIQFEKFFALKNVSLTVYRGEILGLVGRNGAGKSTLLKLVARVIPPTQGRVWVRGRVAPLLELGAGFHPDLSGRENVFLNGALLGYNQKQMEEKFQRIVDFAELWDFIDAPLRTYSSGMVARLGFSVATDTHPDILIVDEILGVGDEAFQQKCAVRIQSFQDYGTTILLVAHNMSTIEKMCSRAALIEHGEMKLVGSVDEVVARYHGS